MRGDFRAGQAGVGAQPGERLGRRIVSRLDRTRALGVVRRDFAGPGQLGLVFLHVCVSGRGGDGGDGDKREEANGEARTWRFLLFFVAANGGSPSESRFSHGATVAEWRDCDVSERKSPPRRPACGRGR